ncbi:MAG TPA: winged helix-turn-helix domain-containing protein [Mycobacteriales bacterium]|jgi:DNA-binding transcriptional ArsR family regulator|nr:winged helix-turn-helix domain-containing protein [Mycobacteriales bacterium]
MSSERRRLTSATELRALSHPTRIALLELLDEVGPLTATQAGERLGESPASASFHLRTLAKYGYVEEAEGGKGRQRPWRTVPVANDIPDDELNAEAKMAADALLQLIRERDLNRLRAWDSARSLYPKAWREASQEMRLVLHLTVEELAALTAAIEATVQPYIDNARQANQRPDTLPVSFGLHAVPTSRHGQEDQS